MATYHTDFSEYTTGVQPSDWTKRWLTAFNWQVVEDAEATGGKLLRMVTTSGSNSDSLLTWDEIDADADRANVEVVVRVRSVGGTSERLLDVVVRGAGGAGTEDAYSARVSWAGDVSRTQKFTDGTYGLIDDIAKDYLADTWYWARIRINGTDLKTKFWDDTEVEPAAWSFEGTDADTSAAGWTGLAVFFPEQVDIDQFGVGTNGDTAPMVTNNLGIASDLWVGHTTSTTASVSARITEATTTVKLAASTDPLFGSYDVGSAVEPDATYDLVKLSISGLTPETDYYLAVEVDGTVDTVAVGEVKTFGTEGEPYNFRFTTGSCSRFHNQDEVWPFMVAAAPDLFMHSGDLHYEDITVDDEDLYQDEFTAMTTQANLLDWFRSYPFYYIWDDHDYAGNNTDSTATSRPAALAAFRRRVPTPALAAPTTTNDDGVYYTFKVGRVRFIVTDLRSQRSDQSTVPEGSSRTMMGTQQKTWFKGVLTDEDNAGDFFVWVNTVPWIDTISSSADTWGGYATERVELADFFKANDVVQRLMIISGDMHASAYDDGTNSDYATGGGAALWVFHCSPIANSNSTKGGPYSSGTPVEEASLYGVFDVVDGGGNTVDFNFSGRYVSEGSGTETEVLSATATLRLEAVAGFLASGARLLSRRRR